MKCDWAFPLFGFGGHRSRLTHMLERDVRILGLDLPKNERPNRLVAVEREQRILANAGDAECHGTSPPIPLVNRRERLFLVLGTAVIAREDAKREHGDQRSTRGYPITTALASARMSAARE